MLAFISSVENMTRPEATSNDDVFTDALHFVKREPAVKNLKVLGNMAGKTELVPHLCPICLVVALCDPDAARRALS